jgi:hypothetical protein
MSSFKSYSIFQLSVTIEPVALIYDSSFKLLKSRVFPARKMRSQYIESGKGFGSSSSSSDPATGVSAASEEDFVDLVGDDDDIFFDEENQSSDCDEDDDKILTEHVTNL